MEAEPQTLGERVEFALAQSGHTMSSAADKIGCSRAAIHQWISGATGSPKNDLLFAFADLTGFEARWIATGEGPRRSAYRLDPYSAKILQAMEPMSEYQKEVLLKISGTLGTSGPPPPLPADERPRG